MSDLEARVVDLELRFMRLEREARELSDVVADQQRTIDALRIEVKRLRAMGEQEEPDATNERPPHY